MKTFSPQKHIKKRVGRHFGRFFQQTHLVALCVPNLSEINWRCQSQAKHEQKWKPRTEQKVTFQANNRSLVYQPSNHDSFNGMVF
jgi:hypothetical protein